LGFDVIKPSHAVKLKHINITEQRITDAYIAGFTLLILFITV